jgi:hypothetical protein
MSCVVRVAAYACGCIRGWAVASHRRTTAPAVVPRDRSSTATSPPHAPPRPSPVMAAQLAARASSATTRPGGHRCVRGRRRKGRRCPSGRESEATIRTADAKQPVTSGGRVSPGMRRTSMARHRGISDDRSRRYCVWRTKAHSPAQSSTQDAGRARTPFTSRLWDCTSWESMWLRPQRGEPGVRDESWRERARALLQRCRTYVWPASRQSRGAEGSVHT